MERLTMTQRRRKLGARQRELYRRSLVLMVASLFFFAMAAARAMSADSDEGGAGPGRGYAYGYGNDDDSAWDFPEEDEYDQMSYDDHDLSARLKKRVVGSRPLYSRRKASRVHDSVTIVIKEETASEIKSKNDLKRNASNNMALQNWVTLFGLDQKGALAGENSPTFAYSNNRAHKSDSTIDRSQYLETTLTGEVVWVHKNGHLVIEAKKTVNVNGEEQTVKLTGVVDPAHMDSKSTVDAKYIIDMAVVYNGSGPMSTMNKRGWLSKAVDFLTPF